MARRDETRALDAMRHMLAQGWTAESLLVDHAAEVLGGDEAARKVAQAVFDRHMRVTGAV